LAVKLLCAADLHLGRRPSRLPASGAGERITSATGWENLVERSLTGSADAVLLAGDVIHESNRSFEAWGPLERGIRRLADAKIPVVAVAGNHDFDTLPDVAREVGGGNLFVLGVGGRWERWTLRGDDGAPRLHVDGWSFPRRHVDADPTGAYDLEPDPEVPVVGLLHGDLDQAGSTYGPVSTTALRARPPAAWILGHIHAPQLREAPGTAPILYPGSLQALDPGEGGMHGAWTLTIEPDRPPTFARVPLSATHYATVEVDAGGAKDAGEVERRVREALTSHLDALAKEDAGHLRVARCRLRLTGRTTLHGRIADVLERVGDFDPAGFGDIRLSTNPRPVVHTRPALDLTDLARGSDAPARLADLLLALDGDADPDPSLLDAAASAATAVGRRSHYVEAGLDPLDTTPGSGTVPDALRRQAGRLLDHLVGEREER